MSKSAQRIDALKTKMNALSSVKTPTEEYKAVSKQIADAEKQQAALNDRIEKFVELGGKTNSKQYKSMQYDMAELENTIAYAKGELQDLVDTGKAFTIGSDSSEYSNLGQQLTEEQARLNSLASQYRNVQNKLGTAEQAQESADSFARMGNTAKTAFSAATKGAISTGGAIGKIAKTLGSATKKLAGFAGKAVLGLSGISSASKTSGGMVERLGTRILRLAKTVFVFGILRRALTSFKNGIQDGFGAYLDYDGTLKSSIAGLRAQLNALKGSLSSAFAPIVSAVVPYLSTLISWVTTAANAVAQFIAILTGHSSYKKAVANVGAVGAAADGAAGSLGDATKAAEELEKALGDYDELKVIDQPKDSSGGSGGGGGGAGSAGDITYEDVEIASAISDFAEKVKEAWANADFTEVGGIIGGKLNEALENIPWDGIQQTAQRIGKSLATLINGFVETSGLGEMIGKTIGEAINTGILGAESFTGNLNFSSVGKFVSDGINVALTSIKWDNLTNVANNLGNGLSNALNSIMTVETFSNIGSSFAKAINSVISGAYTFVNNADWSGWGNAIASSVNNFFSTFDWGKAGLTFSKAVTGILNTLTSAIKGISWVDVGYSIADAIKGIDWTTILKSAADLVGSIFTGLLDFTDGLTGGDWEAYGRELGKVTEEMHRTNKEVSNMIEQAGDWKTATSEEADFAKDLADRYFDLAENTGKTVEQKQEMKDLAKRLVETLPSLRKYYDEETGMLNTTRDAVYDVITALNEKAKTEAATEALEKYYKAQYESKKVMEESAQQGRILEAQKAALAAKEDELTAKIIAGEAGNQDYLYSLEGIKNQLSGNTAGINVLNEKLVENKKEQEEATENYKEASKEIENVNKWISDYSDSTETASTKTKDLTEKLNNLSAGSQLTITLKGLDATYNEKLKVVAEVTGVDYSNVPDSEKAVEDAYAEIVNAHYNLPAEQKLATGITAVMDYWKQNFVGGQMNGFTAGMNWWAKLFSTGRVDGYTAGMNWWHKLFGTGRVDGYTAGMSSWKRLFKVGTISGFIAKATKFTDAIPVWKKVLSGFAAKITGRKADGGVYQNGVWSSIPQRWQGGILSHGVWGNIPAYASGGRPHGTMFVAGEAGPEIVGHVGGRTEVLNKSQLASTMYTAILAGMSNAVNSLGRAVLQNMAECTNLVISNMGYIVDAIYNAGELPMMHKVQFAGMSADYAVPDTNRINLAGGAGNNSRSTIDYEKLADAVAARSSNNLYQFVAQLNGKTIYDETVRQDQLYRKQTGKSGFES